MFNYLQNSLNVSDLKFIPASEILFLRTLDFSLSQNIIVVKDNLSCSTEHFIRS